MSRKKMTGREFEEHCAGYLRRRGFKKIEMTKASGDQGVDILARRKGKTYAIQCKYYKKPVGNKAVQEAYAGMQYYDCDKGMVMTNSTFTKGAIELAGRTGVALWEGVPRRKAHGNRLLFLIVLLALLAAAMYFTIEYA